MHEIRPARSKQGGGGEGVSSSSTSTSESRVGGESRENVTPGGLQTLGETSPTRDSGAEPGGKKPEDGDAEARRNLADVDADVFWPSTGRDTERPKASAREPLTPLQNRTRGISSNARTADAESLGLALHSHWPSSSPTKFQDIDTESESWVDTDVEDSELGDNV